MTKYIVLGLVAGLIAIFLWGMSSSRASEACPKGSVAEITARAAQMGLPVLFSDTQENIAATKTYVTDKYGAAVPFDWAAVTKIGLFTRKDGELMIFMIDKDDCALGILLDSTPGQTTPKTSAPALLPHGLRMIRG